MMKPKTVVTVAGALLGVLIILAVVIISGRSQDAQQSPVSPPPATSAKKNIPTTYTISYKNSLYPEAQMLVFYKEGENFRNDTFSANTPGAKDYDTELRIYQIRDKRFTCINEEKKGWICQEDDESFSNRSLLEVAPLSWDVYTDGAIITPIASKKILGLNARCFQYEFPDRKESYCLHPDNDLILQTRYMNAYSLSLDSISPSIFTFPAPLTKFPPEFMIYTW